MRRVRMSEAIPPYPYTPSWIGQVQFYLYSLLYFGQNLLIFMALWIWRQINKPLERGKQNLGFSRGWPYQKARELLPYLTRRHPCAAFRAITLTCMNTAEVRIPPQNKLANQARKYNLFNYTLLRMLYRDSSRETRHDTTRYVATRHDTSRKRKLVTDIPSHNTGYSYV
jgi:hypothetical protein